jgi:glycosyltransferase involved in cell wall biosynthesis
MQTRPLVSILTPSFNQARWLPQNLASVAAQTYINIEHVVMDGGSIDGSAEILRATPEIIWRTERDSGQSHALNKALSLSRGEIIGWLNADDFYFPDAIACAVEAFARYPDVSVIYGHAALVDADGWLLHLLWSPRFSYALLQRYHYIFQPAAFIRRDAVEDRFVDEGFESWMDRELWLRLAKSHRFKRVNRILAADRHHSGRKSYRRDLAEADRLQLIESYGSAYGSGDGIQQRALRAMGRIAGISLVVQPTAIARLDVPFDSRRKVLVRQVARMRGRL